MSDTKAENGAATGGGGFGAIPATARETVRRLKEIVNRTDQEIYATLKECNMDADEAVNRLLTQDTFHEVKSKREKKKETKGTSESRFRQRLSSSSSGRGFRIYTDYSGHSGSYQISSNGFGLGVHNSIQTSASLSKYDSVGNTIPSTSVAVSNSVPSQTSSTVHHKWSGALGQLSMADVVRMGRPQGKPSGMPIVAAEMCNSYTSDNGVTVNKLQASAGCSTTNSSELNQEVHSYQGSGLKTRNTRHEPVPVVSQHDSHDECLLSDQQLGGNDPIISEACNYSANHPQPLVSSSLLPDGMNSRLSPHLDDTQVVGHDNDRSQPVECAAFVPNRQGLVDSSDDDSALDGYLKNISSCSSQIHLKGQLEDKDVHTELLSAVNNLHHLSLNKEQGTTFVEDNHAVIIPGHLQVNNLHHLSLNKEQGTTFEEDNPAVIIPGHLQVSEADCSFLSFGNFRPSVTASIPQTSTSVWPKSNLEITPVTDNPFVIDQSDSRNPEYYNNEQLMSIFDDHVPPGVGRRSSNYGVTSFSQPEDTRYDTSEAIYRSQYNIPFIPSYSLSDTAQLDAAAYTHAQTNSQTQKHATLSQLTGTYAESVPSNMLAGDAQYGQNHPSVNQLATTNHSNSLSSLSEPTISMLEASRAGLLTTLQPTLQTASCHSISTGLAFPKHLPGAPYSCGTLPLSQLANMVGYPFSGSSAFQQSPAALHSAGANPTVPQFKSSSLLNVFCQSVPEVTGYGGSGNSLNNLSSFIRNPSTIASREVGYEEALGSQYKGGYYSSANQNWNSSMRLHEAGLQMPSAATARSYYGLQGQNQHGVGVRLQDQQAASVEMLGHPKYYNYRSEVSREHQQYLGLGRLNGYGS